MLLFCIGSTSWCCSVVALFRCSLYVPLFRGIPIVLPVLCCSVSLLVFWRSFVFRSSVFQCSWFYIMPFEWAKPCKFAIVAKKRKRKKRKKDREQAEKQNFIALADLVRSRNKVFIESQRLFFCQQKEDMMEWPRHRIWNVIEIKSNEMIQSFLLERSWNQWFLSKIEDFLL